MPNKELKLTKPSIMELRSLTPVLGLPWRVRGASRRTARGRISPGVARGHQPLCSTGHATRSVPRVG
jgi:hypothetical protein